MSFRHESSAQPPVPASAVLFALLVVLAAWMALLGVIPRLIRYVLTGWRHRRE